MLKSLNFFFSFVYSVFQLIFNKLDINQWKKNSLALFRSMSKERLFLFFLMSIRNFAFKRNIKTLGNVERLRFEGNIDYLWVPAIQHYQSNTHTHRHTLTIIFCASCLYSISFAWFVTIHLIWWMFRANPMLGVKVINIFSFSLNILSI